MLKNMPASRTYALYKLLVLHNYVVLFLYKYMYLTPDLSISRIFRNAMRCTLRYQCYILLCPSYTPSCCEQALSIPHPIAPYRLSEKSTPKTQLGTNLPLLLGQQPQRQAKPSSFSALDEPQAQTIHYRIPRLTNRRLRYPTSGREQSSPKLLKPLATWRVAAVRV